MNIKQLIGQKMIIGISGRVLLQEEKQFIRDYAIGGVILFARNLESPAQIHSLCSEIQSLKNDHPQKVPLFIGIDMEGGRVHRLKPPFTQWPAVKLLGDLGSPNMAFAMAFAMGQELKSVGINLNFSPSLDILTNPSNTVIGDRSAGESSELVAKIGSGLIRGFTKSGILACAKHFPGHGNTLIDSHEDLPVEPRSLSELMDRELIPFKRAFKSGLDMVMSSHILFDSIDAKYPVTLSKIFCQDILKKDLRFRGLLVTDDLDMGALKKHFAKPEIAVLATQAGADILLYCNEPESPQIAIEAIEKALADKSISLSSIEESVQKIQKLKTDQLKNSPLIAFHDAINTIGSKEHLHLAEQIREQKISQISEN